MSQMEETTILKLSPKASFQSVGEGAVILMVDTGQLYTCNETTEAFLNAVDGKRDFGAIVDVVLNEFEVDRDTLREDLRTLAADLSTQGIVVTA